MAKNEEKKQEAKQEEKKAGEMTLAEAKAFRKSLVKPEVIQLTMEEKREKFRVFWAQEKNKYGKAKDIEDILWVHCKAAGFSDPEKFEEGLKHFGLKKIR